MVSLLPLLMISYQKHNPKLPNIFIGDLGYKLWKPYAAITEQHCSLLLSGTDTHQYTHHNPISHWLEASCSKQCQDSNRPPSSAGLHTLSFFQSRTWALQPSSHTSASWLGPHCSVGPVAAPWTASQRASLLTLSGPQVSLNGTMRDSSQELQWYYLPPSLEPVTNEMNSCNACIFIKKKTPSLNLHMNT